MKCRFRRLFIYGAIFLPLIVFASFLLHPENVHLAVQQLSSKRSLPVAEISPKHLKNSSTTVSVVKALPASNKKTVRPKLNVSPSRPPIKKKVHLVPKCPEIPKGLVGLRASNMSDLTVKELERMFSFLKPGGDYSPPHCRPAQRTAIIIPYRNRSAHLRILLHNLVPFLVRQELSFTFFVMEMEEPTTFNRALLLNAGILEALKADNYTCFIFHDVDLIPLNDHNLYRCGKQPQHFAVALNKWDYKIKYPEYFGGVTALSRDQIEKVNGFSNLYFGWGGEDDDLLRRVLSKGMQAERKTLNIARYDMILHKIDKGNEVNPIAIQILEKATSRLSIDGLNSIRYTRDSIELKPLYTWIKIFVNMTDVIMNAPAYERSLMMNNTGTVKNETV